MLASLQRQHINLLSDRIVIESNELKHVPKGKLL